MNRVGWRTPGLGNWAERERTACAGAGLSVFPGAWCPCVQLSVCLGVCVPVCLGAAAETKSSSGPHEGPMQPQQVLSLSGRPCPCVAGNRRLLFQLPPGRAMPDGLCVDSVGTLWVACIDGGKIIRLDPQTGA